MIVHQNFTVWPYKYVHVVPLQHIATYRIATVSPFTTTTKVTLSKLGADSQKSKYIPKGAICVTCIASPGLIAFATKESQTNQQLNSVVCEREEHRYFLYFELKNFFEFSSGAKVGNTFANMNKGDFSAIPVLVPSTDILLSFQELVSPSFALSLTNSEQNHHLTALRDWLLPMLMNGQVTVR